MLTIYTLGTHPREGLYCDAEGLTYGGMQLVAKSPRGMFEPCTLDGFFKSALADRQGGIRAVANALNKNDLPLALIYAVHLRLPLYDAETIAKLAKYDPNEPRDSQGRWTTGDSPSSGLPGIDLIDLMPDFGDNDSDDDSDEDNDDDTDNSRDGDEEDSDEDDDDISEESATQEDASQFSPDKEGFHYYTAGPNLVCSAEQQCTAEEMAGYLSRFAVPGQNPGLPIANGDISDVYMPETDQFVGKVTTKIDDNGFTIINITKAGHLFYDGMVTRTVFLASDGSWMISTTGIGNNVVPTMNVFNGLFGPGVFSGIDRAMAHTITHDHNLR